MALRGALAVVVCSSEGRLLLSERPESEYLLESLVPSLEEDQV